MHTVVLEGRRPLGLQARVLALFQGLEVVLSVGGGDLDPVAVVVADLVMARVARRLEIWQHVRFPPQHLIMTGHSGRPPPTTRTRKPGESPEANAPLNEVVWLGCPSPLATDRALLRLAMNVLAFDGVRELRVLERKAATPPGTRFGVSTVRRGGGARHRERMCGQGRAGMRRMRRRERRGASRRCAAGQRAVGGGGAVCGGGCMWGLQEVPVIVVLHGRGFWVELAIRIAAGDSIDFGECHFSPMS